MSTDQKDRVKQETHKRLSKYGTPQLLAKLDSDALLGLSKQVAIEILESRKQDVTKYKGETWQHPDTKKVVVPEETKSESELPTAPPQEKQDEKKSTTPQPKVEKTPKAKVEKAPLKKESKPKEAKKERKSIELIDEDDKKVAKIFADKEMTKTDKIIALLQLGYSVNQISKSSLKAHYSFCHTIAGKLAKGEE